jgi:putative acetyltransferase
VIEVRPERPPDAEAIRRLNRAAFGGDVEAALVDTLRAQAAPLVSLVADDGGSVVGHVMFSPVVLFGHEGLMIMALAPLAVLPALQRRGIGSALAGAGLDRCRELGCQAVVVLGHPAYYPRFGFVPASRFGVASQYAVPDDVFMAMELNPGALQGVSGTVRYHAAFPRS